MSNIILKCYQIVIYGGITKYRYMSICRIVDKQTYLQGDIMGYSKYTEEQITEFINQANEMGISPAMRHLGYPASYHTAKTFYEKRGVEMPTINTLAQMARNIGVFYTDKEKVIAAQAIIDRSVEQLYQDNLTSDDINKLGNAIHKAIQTINLVEGKSTAINESRSKDGSDLAIMDLLNEAKMRNEIVKDQLANKDQYQDRQTLYIGVPSHKLFY